MELTVEKWFGEHSDSWKLSTDSQEKLRKVWPNFQPRTISVTKVFEEERKRSFGEHWPAEDMYYLLSRLTGTPVDQIRVDVTDLQVTIEFLVKPPTNLMKYRKIADELCLQRRLPDWKPENDRELLAKLEDLFQLLANEHQRLVIDEGRRFWPDEVDERLSHE